MSKKDKTPTVEFAHGPIIFARAGSPALKVLHTFAGRIQPGAIFPVTEEELSSLKNENDMLVIWR